MTLAQSCRLFGISRQSLYQHKQRAQAKANSQRPIRAMVESVRMRMPRIGTRKLHYLLGEQLAEVGIKIGRDGLFDYLREQKLLVKPVKCYTQTTMSRHWLRKHPNLLAGREPTRVEEVFVSDITYIKSARKTHYLSLVTDAYSRKIMGYILSDDMEAETVGKALTMAVDGRISSLPLIHHSDRGLQYCSAHYQSLLAGSGIRASMTDGYDCYQNALAERINGILKQEFLIWPCANKKDLQNLVDESISVYNNERPHLSLQMQTPNQVHKKAEEVPLLRLN